jgi:hypothetical protein
MNYFVNVWEITDGSAGPYRTYRLYSGDSPDEIKFNLVSDLKDTWLDVSKKIDNFKNPTNMDFGQIGDFFTDVIYGKDDSITDCHIEISDPYTNIAEAARFYGNHLDDEKEFLDEEVDFYSYGEFSKELEKVLPLLSALVRDYNVHISPDIVTRLLARGLIK